MSIHNIEGSKPFHPHALLLQKRREEREAFDRETQAMFDRLDGDRGELAKIGEKIAGLQKLLGQARTQIAKNDSVLKSMNAVADIRKQHNAEQEASRLRNLLQRTATLRKSGRWAKLPFSNRASIEKAELAASKELAKIDAREQARKALKRDADKNHQAMVERGVTFNTMATA